MKKLIVVGIIILLVGMSVPSTGIVVEKVVKISSDGNTLYVGGSGPGNYSKIQDAIDNASDGDTVFVYNGTYYENVVIHKSIKLIGENRNTTTIDGRGNGSCCISTGLVNISGFTINNSVSSDLAFGIIIESNNNAITGNKIIGNLYGIFFFTLTSKNNNISDNLINQNYIGIRLWVDENNTISSNTIINNIECGIQLFYSNENEISNNSISGSYVGIPLIYSQQNVIIGNTIKNNNFGIELFDASHNLIVCNNIIDNQLGINLIDHCFSVVKENNFIKNAQSVEYNYFLNRWICNYWDDWDSVLPKPIRSKCTFVVLSELISEILKANIEISIPWIQFDWHPAKEPYDI
jgi:parallel beta-helix repeat protein